ncbi:MAG TPA: CdaR family protein [Bryobacteraceae bacterium]|nr:CdaR family protein [Bryobacteraceae bacterium]
MKWVGIVFHNFWWKVLALGIAVVLWAVVANEPELSTFMTVRLAYKNLPDDLEISEISNESVGTILLELRGPSGQLRGLGDSAVHPAVTLDMSGVQPGQRTFPIGDGNVNLSRGLRLVRAIPSEVRFRFERRLERDVPVQVRFAGEGTHGYVVARHQVEPDKLRIAGPASRVARVTAVVTDPVDVSGAVGSSAYQVNAYVDDPFVRLQSSPLVRVAVTMMKK